MVRTGRKLRRRKSRDQSFRPTTPAEEPLHAFVERVQRHTHSVACRKGKDKHCRFSFPRPPSERTILAKLPEDGVVLKLRYVYQETNADILKRVRDVLINSDNCSSMTLDEVLREANIASENYHHALAMSFSGRHLVLQRRPCDVYINNYNLTCLAAWKANMDVQPVLDAYACIMYIVAYVTKDEREMGEVLREVLRSAKKEHSDKYIRTQMKKIGSVFITHREVSAQEAVFRLLGLTMLSCSVKRVFVPTDLLDNRVRILKASRCLEILNLDSEDEYTTGIIQRYIARSSSLDSMCLADFAVKYDVCYNATASQNAGLAAHDNDENDVQPADEPPTEKQYDSICRKTWARCAIVRHAPF